MKINIKLSLLNKFGDIIKDAFIEKENNINFLRVEINSHKIDKVIEISRKISKYLDETNFLEQKYYLDVFSLGTDQKIELKNIFENLNKNILLILKQPIKNIQKIEGKIIEEQKDSILIKWNAKGQFRKLKIKKSNIKQLKIYAKAKEEKNGRI